MPNDFEQILADAKKLDKEERFREVLELLIDEEMEKYSSKELYCIRARAYDREKKYDLGIKDCEKALELDSEYYCVYVRRGGIYLSTKKYDKAIQDYNKVLELKPANSTAYYNRGNCWWYKKDYDRSIRDYNKTIDLEPEAHDAYYSIGLSYRGKGDFENAKKYMLISLKLGMEEYRVFHEFAVQASVQKNYILAERYYQKAIDGNNKDDDLLYDYAVFKGDIKDFQTAIALYSKAIDINMLAKYYHNRGVLYLKLGKSSEAISDLLESIKIDSSHTISYDVLGAFYSNKEDYETSLKYYSKSIEFNPKDANAYIRRGQLLEKIKQYESALEDYKQAVWLEPENKIGDSNMRRVREIIEEEEVLNNTNATFQSTNSGSIISAIYIGLCKASFHPNTINEILKLCVDIKRNCIDRVKKYALAIDKDISVKYLVHYTSINTLNSILIDEETSKPHINGKQRFYNAIYMNDPEEGNVVLDFLGGDIKDVFASSQLVDQNVYIGSYMPAPEHEDNLLMWRTYGKDVDNKEAAGCSLVIHKDFFDYYNDLDEYPTVSFHNSGSDITGIKPPQYLYKVLYYDYEKKEFLNDGGCELKSILSELKERLNKLFAYQNDDRKKQVLSLISIYLLNEIRYLFKNAAYAFENEYRVLKFVAPQTKNVFIDRRSVLYKQFVESNKPVVPFLQKVYLGPKVPNPNQWVYINTLLKSAFKDFSLLRSKHKLV